ncbi:methionyl-tRNA formyltransferase [Lentilactobacillus senioris]|uniref:methionyl-tRNA formyltransferase n=1 Tax=Lentilactobacillus senioris TaxID=931534 RepID=UPI00227E4A5E|nr:methionyl-tRNA formyltransferase [Lentilactobacillus senioris]MCY9806898.1 methionyl-tRNA formyltransferase [Lentilactobacillus senioris]
MTSVIFMGTPKFSVPVLQGLVDNHYDILAVVTQPDRPVGRKHKITPSPVKQLATELNLPVLQPEKLSGSEELEQLIAMQPDLIVTAAFGQFLPSKLLAAAKIAAVNVHGSLLPKYRGGAPVQYAIMNGDTETGITIMYMEKKMDAGDILAQQAIAIGPDDDVATMFDKLSIIGRDLLLTTLPKVIDGSVVSIPQEEDQVVFSPNIQPDQEKLDFTQPARLVDAKVRGLRPAPGAYVNFNGQRTKIWQTTPLTETTDLQPGQIVKKTKHQLWVAAGEHSVLQLEVIQPAGKPKQDITAYLNGSGQNLKEEQQVIFNE